MQKFSHIDRITIAYNPDGTFKGAMSQAIERIIDTDGITVLSEKYADPVPADQAALTGLLDAATTAALTANAGLQAQVTTLTAGKTAAEQATATVTAERDAVAAELAALQQSLQPTDANGVPTRVTRFQARAALYNAGLLDMVEAMIADPATNMLIKLAWADAQTFERNSPTVLALAAGLGLNAAQLDGLFVQAAQITV